ncbi:unnamed protein product [Candidula unifasciata]|uniref:Uncharacterized protein n=1 Tax=Candidula unifasciata TaxID=100452 RepID=A0A8S3ZB39_9EUPU|nr:unnamed protein product [Candidula unifasciata]
MAYYIPYRIKPETHVYNPVQHNQPALTVFDVNKAAPAQDLRYLQGTDQCSVFEKPYFSPSYLPVPVNYNTRLPHWSDSRITKDWLAHWGNQLIHHDRAFGAWHVLYGTTYFYGDNRRL